MYHHHYLNSRHCLGKLNPIDEMKAPYFLIIISIMVDRPWWACTPLRADAFSSEAPSCTSMIRAALDAWVHNSSQSWCEAGCWPCAVERTKKRTWATLTELASYCSSLDSGNAIVVVVEAAVSAGLV